jgi:cellobiose phosphorylase
MTTTFGHFDDAAREYVVTQPLTPAPWINYLGNTSLTAFISQQAGGLVFQREPLTRRITRYHYLPAPQDRPGFYVYVKDQTTGVLWNPHFAPTCASLDTFECRHGLGYSRFTGERDGVRVSVRYFIPPDDDVLLWDVNVANTSPHARLITLASYAEFGVLEFMRELFWCYLKNHIGFEYERDENWIKYLYHVFQAPFTPAMFFSCTRQADGFECSRDAFCGPGGSLERPTPLLGKGFSNSQLTGGGHGCGSLAVNMNLAPGAAERFAYVLGAADDWTKARALRRQYADLNAIDAAFAALKAYWDRKTGVLQARTGDADVDRSVNVWNPLNCQITLERTRDISTDHVGVDGMRYRDTMQDALAVASFDPEFARERIRLIFAAQTKAGAGCFAFYPYSKEPVHEKPERCDNTVWPIYTVANLVNETGDLSFFNETVPFRDGGGASVYDHILLGLKYIWDRRGPHGLPSLFDADWNDGLAIFGDEKAESVMLGMQMVYSAKLLRTYALALNRPADAAWCDTVAAELERILNSDVAWDGEWYRRLLLSNGINLGSRARPQGQIYLEPQPWAVIAGIGRDGRGQSAMNAVHERLNTERGLMIVAPPYTGFPTPNDPLTGNAPGTGENGSIFCHANTWAIIAECLLGNGDGAFEYYRRLLPSVASAEAGAEHWGREPYAFVSSIVGPARGKDFGQGGISWLTGTASWMYIAVTQYILGLQPTLEGLRVRPCLPSCWPSVRVARRFRGKTYEIELRNRPGAIKVNGRPLQGDLIG